MVVLKDKNGPQSEVVKKNIEKIFKGHGLDIMIQCDMEIVNYADVTFNLRDSEPSNEIKYIYKESNHPLSAIPQITLSMESSYSLCLLTKNISGSSTSLTKSITFNSKFSLNVAYPKRYDPLLSPQLFALTPKKLVEVPKTFIDKVFVSINVFTSRVKVPFFVFIS